MCLWEWGYWRDVMNACGIVVADTPETEATGAEPDVAKKIEASVKEALAASDRTHAHNTRLNLSRNSLVRIE